MTNLLGEFFGTMMLITFGAGVVACVLLKDSKGNGGGWIVITAGWAFGVMLGVFTSVALGAPQADLNPAVTLAKTMLGVYGAGHAFATMLAQIAGGFTGGAIVWLAYLPHWAPTEDPGLKLAVFSTAPAIRSYGQNFLCEVIGTFMAGGVALNCVANGLLIRSGIFKNVWIQPASGDSGGALGAAQAAWHIWGGNERPSPNGIDAMQGNGTSVAAVANNSHHLPPGAALAPRNERLQQRMPKTLPHCLLGNIDGIFQTESESRPRAVQPGVTIAHNSIVLPGHQIGQTKSKHGLTAAPHFFHTGWQFFKCCQPVQHMYDGASFARDGVVFVNFNYRVGPLGFYDFSMYDKRFESNCGVSDQIAALRWVRDNIAAFGGDPNNVTIAGESAGGTGVYNMLASPAAKGLFQKAIAESGVTGNTESRRMVEMNNTIFFEKLGINPRTDMAKLLDMPAQDMLAAATFTLKEGPRRHPGIFMPGPVKDDLLPMHPWEAMAQGNARDVKVILGTNRNEGTLFALLGLLPKDWQQVEKMLRDNGAAASIPAVSELYASEKGMRAGIK